MLKKKFIISGLIAFIALGYLGYMGFQGAATYYYTVAELGQQDSAILLLDRNPAPKAPAS